MLVNAIGKACGFFVEEETISDIIMAIAGVLVVFGIVSMPKQVKEKEDPNKEEEKK